MRELLRFELSQARGHMDAALNDDRSEEQRLTDIVLAQRSLARALEEASLELAQAQRTGTA